jgi:ribosome-associated translation inhibitor RaiA
VLRGLAVTPVSASATFVDDNGPRGGGVRCALTVRLPHRPALRAERTAETPRVALDAAFAALARQLAQYRERQRERRRRPKKYYAAKRLLA